TMNLDVFLERLADFRCKGLHILTVFQNRYPFPVLVGSNALEAFQHFVAFNKKAGMSNVVVGQNRAPYGMSMQNGTRADALNDRDVQQCFGRRLAARWLYDFAVGINFENVIG